jgi:peptidoglycan hydrolase-like protein with peptidoglycan-binding domain
MSHSAIAEIKTQRQIAANSRALSAIAAFALACAFLIAASPSVHAQTQASPSASTAAPAPKPATAKKKSSKKHHSSRREPSQKAPTADRITEIQSALSRNGFYDGNPNGKWDASSVAAMQKFQSANGLDATGKLDAPSLQKLGLGSETAGVYAPETPHVPAQSSAPTNPAPTAVAPSTLTSAPATTQPQPQPQR